MLCGPSDILGLPSDLAQPDTSGWTVTIDDFSNLAPAGTFSFVPRAVPALPLPGAGLLILLMGAAAFGVLRDRGRSIVGGG